MKRIKILLVILPIILFILLAICIKAGTILNIEENFYFELIENKTDAFTAIMKIITHLGDPISIILICFALFIFSKTRIKFAIPLSITIIVSAISNIFLKEIFARERPDILRLVNESSYSFPSGHAMTNSALYMMAILLVNVYIRNNKFKIPLIILFTIIPIIIGISRVYLGVHYIGDVIGGFLLGITVSIIAYAYWKKVYIDKKHESI